MLSWLCCAIYSFLKEEPVHGAAASEGSPLAEKSECACEGQWSGVEWRRGERSEGEEWWRVEGIGKQ